MAKSFADAISMEIRSDVPCRKDFVFTVSPEALRKESARALQRVAMAVNIPGFRRGKAPAALLQSKYAEDIENEIKRMLVYTAYDKIDAADAGEMLNCNLEKDIQINKDADTVFTMIADIAPEFEVGDYKALKVEAAAADVSDEQVEERVNFYRTMYANYAEVTEAAAAGDMLKVNYTSDFPVPEDASASLKRQLQAEDGYVWLSEPEIIPGSMAALTGVVAGDERTFDAVYAEDYREAALAGKTVKYTVKVLTVQRKKDLTDEELCSKTQAPSIAEFRKMIRMALENEAKGRRQQELAEKIYEELDKAVPQFDLPPAILASETSRELRKIANDLVKSAEDAEAFKKDTAKHNEAAGEAAKKTLRRTFILRKIAQKENITVGQDEINAQIGNMSRYYGYKPNELRNMLEKTGGMGELELDMMNGKVLDFLAGICG